MPVPDPRRDDHHGTRCAGQIVAQPNNKLCGVGVAHGAQVSAIRILSEQLSTLDEANAVVFRNDGNHIYSCSWGPADDGRAIDGPAALVLRAFVSGLLHGREKRGSLYVFAAGNGRFDDNCNYDGYANGIFSITIGAIDTNDETPPYMEPCAAQLAVTYSSNYVRKIATTDLGDDRCTTRHGGTSAAAPLAAGLLALVLSARPELTWHDVQRVIVDAAVSFNLHHGSWFVNGAGRMYSELFGFGKLDADQLVTKAQSHTPVNRPAVRSLPYRSLGAETDTAFLDDRLVKLCGLDHIKTLEHVTVTLTLQHPRRGDLQLFLVSPAGTRVRLMSRRPHDRSGDGLSDWTFMTVGFWGEPIAGRWVLALQDEHGGGRGRGRRRWKHAQWRISFWGELQDGAAFEEEKYAESFVSSYYPPSRDHFADRDGVWTSLPRARRRFSKWIGLQVVGVVVGTGAILLWSMRKLRRMRMDGMRGHDGDLLIDMQPLK